MILSVILYYIFTHLYKLKLRMFQKYDALEQLDFIFHQLKQIKAKLNDLEEKGTEQHKDFQEQASNINKQIKILKKLAV